MGAIGVLMAVLERNMTGRGQVFIDRMNEIHVFLLDY